MRFIAQLIRDSVSRKPRLENGNPSRGRMSDHDTADNLAQRWYFLIEQFTKPPGHA